MEILTSEMFHFQFKKLVVASTHFKSSKFFLFLYIKRQRIEKMAETVYLTMVTV